MDKKSFTGLILIFLIMIGFYWINKPSEEQRAEWQRYHEEQVRAEQMRADSLRRAELLLATEAKAAEVDADSAEALKRAKYGLLADAVEGQAEFYTLENAKLRIVISTKGGRIYSAELKDYKAFGGEPLKLFDGDKNEFGFQFTHANRFFYTSDLYFSVVDTQSVGDTLRSITLAMNAGDGRLTYTYALGADDYAVDFTLGAENLGDKIYTSGAALDLNWVTDMPQLEKSHKSESMWSSIYYRYPAGDVEELGTTGSQTEDVNMQVEWVALKDQYFSTVLHAKNNFAGAQLRSEAYESRDTLIKHTDIKVGVKFDMHYNTQEQFRFIFVPNYFYTLDSFEGLALTELLPLGWGIFGWINEYFIIPLFKYIEALFDNYGLVILLLTIIIKVILFPFSISSFKSQAKMRVLKPQIDEINAKIPAEKAMERQQETMKLYKRAGVSPMGGCLPMLLQMPILFAAFRFFPAAVELRGQSFLWADDLSTYDSILDLPFSIPFYGDHVSLFCLLMCIVNVVYTRYNMQGQATNQAMPGMKVMMYFMPVMLLFFFNDYPAGLCYYYFISTLFTVLQTTIIKAFFIDDKAILAQIEANKRRPQSSKKSKWQLRYEEMMKEQMRRQQQQRR